MRTIIFSSLLFLTTGLLAQNVGIGTPTPLDLLDVYSDAGNSFLRVSNGNTNAQSGVRLYTAGGINTDFVLYGSNVGLNVAGISAKNLTRLWASIGPLMLGTGNAQPLYFVTNALPRMTISDIGNIGIGVNPFTYRLAVEATTDGAIYAKTTAVAAPGQFINSISGRISNNSLSGAGITGYAENSGGGTTGISPGMYGVAGSSLEVGYGVAGFGNSGSGGLLGEVLAGTGKALRTIGAVQMTGLGEAPNRVLTTDAFGNASWQTSQLLAHTHYGEVWNGAAEAGLSITTSLPTGRAIRVTASSATGSTYGVLAENVSPSGYGVYAVNRSNGNWHPGVGNTGVAGLAGNGIGIMGASVTGTSIYGLKDNFGAAVGSVAIFENKKTGNTSAVVVAKAVNGQSALELNNGYLKVAGTNKTAFTITANAANSSGHILRLSYLDPQPSDIVFVTHNFNPGGVAVGAYHNQAVGVFWNGLTWAVYNENTTIPIINISFNVMIIKQ